MTTAIGRYRHYKGNLYDVLGVATNSETGERLVVYQSCASGELWVRPVGMWGELVERSGQMVPRFQRMDVGRRARSSGEGSG